MSKVEGNSDKRQKKKPIKTKQEVRKKTMKSTLPWLCTTGLEACSGVWLTHPGTHH